MEHTDNQLLTAPSCASPVDVRRLLNEKRLLIERVKQLEGAIDSIPRPPMMPELPAGRCLRSLGTALEVRTDSALAQWFVRLSIAIEDRVLLSQLNPSEMEANGSVPRPTVEDMDRRCAELLFSSDGERTFGAIRAQLISEFGEELFNAAASR